MTTQKAGIKKVKKKGKKLGFTFVEVLVVMSIIAILASVTIAGFRFFQQQMDLDSSTEKIISALTLAQNKTTTSLAETSYGVHFSTTSYVSFVGPIYNPADASNEVYYLPNNVEIFSINLNSGGEEVIFNRPKGTTNQFGQIGLRLVADPTKTRVIYIESTGKIGMGASSIPLDSRQTDARHIHFNYERVIKTDTEKIILNFSDPPNPMVNYEIPIKDNLNAQNQIEWQGTIDVNGSIQSLEIKTQQLNNPLLTTFCIHHDRRYNNKALSISLSGDTTGSLVDYTADGQESRGTSVYLATGSAGNPERQ